MTTVIKWVFWVTFWVLVAAFFHYTLPQRDMVRVVDTFEQRVDFGENSIFWASPDVGSDATAINRDVLFIQAVRDNDRVMVYRNEDTGWSWPPYFKFDTKNLQTEAADLKSTKADPQWAVITHYGWRNEFLSIFPNAISIRPVVGPDAGKGIPWLNIVVLLVFFAIIYAIWVRWRRFKAARITPTLDAMEDGIAEQREGFSRWLGTWRSKK
ncbi:DUF1523 family protein [Sulfitobacter aestuariivivens]|uniref:DUF1523 family protein n=1 Tax=Sulfitobacter aestuariivivens TaxID=2766981 RepID=A0A927D6T5_9RHOB|nr:DUF1523 family protein [Sulfitobacter aestuariivivens]MBD3664859.1 DUF1523 family protein [Sulfitobacter aestuariivivens]